MCKKRRAGQASVAGMGVLEEQAAGTARRARDSGRLFAKHVGKAGMWWCDTIEHFMECDKGRGARGTVGVPSWFYRALTSGGKYTSSDGAHNHPRRPERLLCHILDEQTVPCRKTDTNTNSTWTDITIMIVCAHRTLTGLRRRSKATAFGFSARMPI